MKKVIFALSLLACVARGEADPNNSSSLPRSTPEKQGVSSTSILAFIDDADAHIDTMNSFMFLRHGKVIAEAWWTPYAPQTRHSLYSLSKSFTSTAVGLAVSEKKLTIDDLVLPIFPADAPEKPGDNLKALRVRDLLSMSTGHHADDLKQFSFTSGGKLTKDFLALPLAHKPGTHFLYNTPGTYMLSALVQEKAGMSVLDYLRPRLFEPLGIDDPVWEASPQGISLGGYGLSIRTEDIARFGQLYLQKGKWNGQQIVPTEWVSAATARQTSNGSNPASDWEQGYGYQFWRCRHGAFRGDGAYGQFCVVMPEQDAVVIITSGVTNMQNELNLVWDRLLPAMKSHSLPPDPSALKKLQTRTASLMVRPEYGSAIPSLTPQEMARNYLFPTNSQKLESLALQTGTASGFTLVAKIGGVERRISCPKERWDKGEFGYDRLQPQVAAGSGAWIASDTFEAKICFYETPFYLTLRLTFSKNSVTVDPEFNVGSAPTKLPQLAGQAR